MSRSPAPAMWNRRIPALVVVLGLVLAGAGTGGLPANATETAPTTAPVPLEQGNYVVMMPEAPAATYEGGVSGLDATRPVEGERLDPTSTDVAAYRSHLREQQEELLDDVGVIPRQQFTLAFNGFAARLTADQAVELAGRRGVRMAKDTLLKPAITETQERLGLIGSSGLWQQLGGETSAGKGVVIGVLDSGIWPENPFFAGDPVTSTTPTTEVGSVYRTADGNIAVVKGDGNLFIGRCDEGDEFPASTCNSKVVSARVFNKGYQAIVPRTKWSAEEFNSPRDGNGHGSHTASTAAGNEISNAVIGSSSFGTSAGMAPGAKLAIYKTCFDATDPSRSGCLLSDNIEAIDQAVRDGVDVINYSIGGGAPDDPASLLETAFMSAATAGIFIAGAAGNEGPGTATVDKNSPWVTTVAASTIHRFEGTVILGDGTRFRGASLIRSTVDPVPVVLAEDAVNADWMSGDPGLCAPNSLEPTLVAGKIVVCDRGAVALSAKSAEVARAGGVGMILVNISPSTVDPDVHALPTIHLGDEDRDALREYIQATGESATASLAIGDVSGEEQVPIPVVASFSARGPSPANGGDLIKPDITAPGVNIIGAVSPKARDGAQFLPMSGTSMASPHVAGLAALILTRHPDWSPMAVKSAMMTTAHDTWKQDNTADRDPFSQGAGFVWPARFMDPGLIYDSGISDWLSFLEGAGVDTGSTAAPVDPSDYNSPSIAIGELTGTQVVRRTVTSTAKGTFRAFAAVPGAKVTVTPRTLTFTEVGQSKSFTVRVERTTAPLGTYTSGFLMWMGSRYLVRSPIAVRPVTLAAPKEVYGTGASGSLTYPVTSGATGTVDLSVQGLAAGEVHTGALPGGEVALTAEGNASTRAFAFQIPVGTEYARFDLDVDDDTTDFDLYVMDQNFARILKLSGTADADERVEITNPTPGTYQAVVSAYDTHGEESTFSLRNFAVGDADVGNLIVSPDPLAGVVGTTTTMTLSWSGLEPDRPYLGLITHPDALFPTIVSIG